MVSIGQPRFAVRPAGTAEAPAYDRVPIEEVPAAQERLDLLTRIDWCWIRRVLEAGDAVGIAVDRADTGALIDAVQARLGFGVVIRLAGDAVLWLCRPDALAWSDEE